MGDYLLWAKSFLVANTSLLETAEHFFPRPWDESTFSTWMGRLKQSSLKGKELFMPIHGLNRARPRPRIKDLILLMGRPKVLTDFGNNATHFI
jgi:hypothetical protein